MDEFRVGGVFAHFCRPIASFKNKELSCSLCPYCERRVPRVRQSNSRSHNNLHCTSQCTVLVQIRDIRDNRALSAGVHRRYHWFL
jgi:hypothetical protein